MLERLGGKRHFGAHGTLLRVLLNLITPGACPAAGTQGVHHFLFPITLWELHGLAHPL
jgi:hypothetical protein